MEAAPSNLQDLLPIPQDTAEGKGSGPRGAENGAALSNLQDLLQIPQDTAELVGSGRGGSA